MLFIQICISGKKKLLFLNQNKIRRFREPPSMEAPFLSLLAPTRRATPWSAPPHLLGSSFPLSLAAECRFASMRCLSITLPLACTIVHCKKCVRPISLLVVHEFAASAASAFLSLLSLMTFRSMKGCATFNSIPLAEVNPVAHPHRLLRQRHVHPKRLRLPGGGLTRRRQHMKCQ